jgi:hypothetical protein
MANSKGYTKQMQMIENTDVALEKIELLASELIEESATTETADIKRVNLMSCMLLDYVQEAQDLIQMAILCEEEKDAD